MQTTLTINYKIRYLHQDDGAELERFRSHLTPQDGVFFSFLDGLSCEDLLNKTRFFAVFCIKNKSCQIVVYGHLERFSQECKRHVGRLGIAIHPSFRSLGLSRLIMDAIIKEGYSCGLSKIWLSVHLSNIKALRLYEKYGFQVEGVFSVEERRGDQMSDVVSMARFLRGENETSPQIPWNQPAIQTEEVASILNVLKSGWLSQGPTTAAFEEALANYTGAKHAVVMNNGTSCLMAMFALSFQPGDQVIFPAFTFVSTLNSALTFGIHPILVDIDLSTGNISFDQVEELLKQSNTIKGVVVVDIGGHPVDLRRCAEISERYGVTILEDAAEAIGAACYGRRVGSFNHLAMFSFHAAKLITTIEGGAVTTNDTDMAQQLRKFRSHGEHLNKKFVWDGYGLNFRSTDLQSAIGLSQLSKLDGFLEKRNQIANLYQPSFEGLLTVQKTQEYVDVHPYMMFFVLVEDEKKRSALSSQLKDEGILCREGWRPLHQQPVFTRRFALETYPVSEDWGKRSLCLPIYNTMTLEEAERVVEVMKEG